MPFMENGNLKSYYYKNGGRNWDLLKKIQVGLEIASGLAWLDGKSFIDAGFSLHCRKEDLCVAFRYET